MPTPLFTIVTVTYNASQQLENTIKSVVEQSYSNIEYIIIDGASKDGTVDIIKKYEYKINYWISEPDKGLYDAMNKGISAATGEYIWFLNAGDILQHANIISELADIIEKKKRPDILYGETDLMDKDGNIFASRRLKTPTKLTWLSFQMGMLVCHQAFIVKRTIAPAYDLQYQFSADFDWCIRCLKNTKAIENTNLRLVNYLYEGLTTANRKASLKERYHIMCKYYGTFVALILHVWFALRFYYAKLTNQPV